jgi:hypothetical protein
LRTEFLRGSAPFSGFSRKSKAPICRAFTAVSNVPWPVSTIQAGPGQCCCDHCIRLSPPSSGMLRSVITTS